jgi:protein-tyrosine-phosphatase
MLKQSAAEAPRRGGLRAGVTAASVVALLNGVGAAAQQTSQERAEAEIPVILFVCEHGAAKSVIAASHFNRLAKQRGLRYRAIARGTHPDEVVAPAAAEGLRAEGIDVTGLKPRRVSAADVDTAARIVALGCDLSSLSQGKQSKVLHWDDVPVVSQDYGAARDALVQRVQALMRDLGANGP